MTKLTDALLGVVSAIGSFLPGFNRVVVLNRLSPTNYSPPNELLIHAAFAVLGDWIEDGHTDPDARRESFCKFVDYVESRGTPELKEALALYYWWTDIRPYKHEELDTLNKELLDMTSEQDVLIKCSDDTAKNRRTAALFKVISRKEQELLSDDTYKLTRLIAIKDSLIK